jgi:hypothetical protein
MARGFSLLASKYLCGDQFLESFVTKHFLNIFTELRLKESVRNTHPQSEKDASPSLATQYS